MSAWHRALDEMRAEAVRTAAQWTRVHEALALAGQGELNMAQVVFHHENFVEHWNVTHVPRIGEHVSLRTKRYVVTKVLHRIEHDRVDVRIKDEAD